MKAKFVSLEMSFPASLEDAFGKTRLKKPFHLGLSGKQGGSHVPRIALLVKVGLTRRGAAR